MKSILLSCSCVALLAGVALFSASSATQETAGPQFTNDNQLVRPTDYREWIYLSSGLGMSYSDSSGDGPGSFTNVFVSPAAYREFVATGTWPDKTMFVLEERTASNKGSINKAGHFQGALEGLGASVNDEKRFPEKWAYFSFDEGAKTARANPKNGCWQCHNSHGAVTNTFVQFYPTLKEVAQKQGTYDEAKAAGGPTGK
jgi:hypothetical protein